MGFVADASIPGYWCPVGQSMVTGCCTTDRGVVSMWPRQSDSTRTDGPSGVIVTPDPLFTNTLRPTIV